MKDISFVPKYMIFNHIHKFDPKKYIHKYLKVYSKMKDISFVPKMKDISLVPKYMIFKHIHNFDQNLAKPIMTKEKIREVR